MGNENTTNFVRIKSQLVMQILTSAAFREELNKAQKQESLEELQTILSNNGYSRDLANELDLNNNTAALNIEKLEGSGVTNVMPDDVEMMTLGGFNLNW